MHCRRNQQFRMPLRSSELRSLVRSIQRVLERFICVIACVLIFLTSSQASVVAGDGVVRTLSMSDRHELQIGSAVFAEANDLSASKLYGCWRWNAPKIQGQPSKAYQRLCFASNMTAYHVSIAPDGGGDELLPWDIVGSAILKIESQSCSIEVLNSELIRLTRCFYSGDWARQCSLMTSDAMDCVPNKTPEQ